MGMYHRRTPGLASTLARTRNDTSVM